jgi:hypothetical protein
LFGVPQIDFAHFRDHVRVVEVVRKVVMAFRDAYLIEGPVAAFAGKQHGRDASRIGLECQQEHVEHQLNVAAEIGRNAIRRVRLRVNDRHPLSAFDALLDFADAGQILIQFLPVAAIEFLLQSIRIVHDEIEDGMLLFLPALKIAHAFLACPYAEKALENKPGIRLGSQRLSR